jgi:monofunctional biosynthetic peptidoglycan transglycosylase
MIPLLIRLLTTNFRRLGFPILFLLLILAILTPNVFILDSHGVHVTRWIRSKGKIEVTVGPNKKDWTPILKISKHVVHAVVAAEDGRFFDHRGFDLVEIQRSLETNFKKGSYVRGGSTITQQVVKMAFLSREKNLIRKLREALGAVFLEMVLDKHEIMNWYLNLAEFGDGVYGVKQGAQHYFNTKPELLTVSQSIHLALVLPSPNRWSAGLRRQNLTDFGHQRFRDILEKMRQTDFITEAQKDQAMATGNFGNPILIF